ncbi:hypothetical protein [Rhizomonospora bruguierae]|uniref:hypothetical protein n=1 Tax=Rhizomonospora bruguierae TaxID=1581705 RepID=UPI001BCDA666|nr:hypothetical protein [Micromonospora sp. NBRC 107566]
MRRGPAVELAAWWIGLTLVWTATLSGLDLLDLVTGAAGAGLCAAAAIAGRRAVAACWRPDPRWAAWLGRLAVSIPVDTARLLPLAPRRRDGHLVERRPAAEPPARAAARRAWGTPIICASPGTLVVDWPRDGGPVLLHTLGSGPPDASRAVTG